jgi:hypothetical protein
VCETASEHEEARTAGEQSGRPAETSAAGSCGRRYAPFSKPEIPSTSRK